MARSLANKTNAQPPDSDYPFGRLTDDSGANDGVPVNEVAYGDIHQFFEKLMSEAGIAHNEQPDNDYVGFQLYDALLEIFGGLRKKIVPIGDWNMDSTSFVTVAHGIADFTKIRRVTVMILADTSSAPYPIEYYDTGLSLVGGNWRYNDASSILIERTTGGIFDSITFDATSFNRGYLVIDYLP